MAASRAEISTDEDVAKRISCINWIYLENVYPEWDLSLVGDPALAAWFRNINVSCQVQGLYDWWHNQVWKSKNKQRLNLPIQTEKSVFHICSVCHIK